jgi:hypothetical protein
VLNADDHDELQQMFLELNPADIHRKIQQASQRLYTAATVRNANDATNCL